MTEERVGGTMPSEYATILSKHRETHLKQLSDYLSIPSISALSKHKPDMQRAAEWTAEQLKQAGLEHVEVVETDGHPVVYGDWLHAEDRPTVLIYGHYDVQPVDPLHLWETPPFEPSIRDGKIYARGATDDKGQVFMHIKAAEALLEADGRLPVNLKFCIEGEEEIGSPHFGGFLKALGDKVAADIVVISDNPMLEKNKPNICYGLRGLCALQIDVKAAKGDLHSGLYGGGVPNAIHALSAILASFHDQDGRIAVEGFYDNVLPLTEEERESYRKLNYDETKTKEELGLKALYGEKGYSYLERVWARPTLEINGVYGGFQEEGIKTVIPSEAAAKLSCRLVPDQDPDEMLRLIEAHIARVTPPGVEVRTTRFDQGNPFLTPYDHPAIKKAALAYERGYGVEPIFVRNGASIPIVETLSRLLDAPVVLMGFGLPDENFHAPNEHFNLDNFDQGLVTLCEYWLELGR